MKQNPEPNDQVRVIRGRRSLGNTLSAGTKGTVIEIDRKDGAIGMMVRGKLVWIAGRDVEVVS